MNAPMPSGLMLGLLILLVVLVAINLLIGLVMWWRHSGLADRVTKLEIHYQHSLGRAEVTEIRDRLSSLEGQVETTNRMLRTVQEHLLEND